MCYVAYHLKDYLVLFLVILHLWQISVCELNYLVVNAAAAERNFGKFAKMFPPKNHSCF